MEVISEYWPMVVAATAGLAVWSLLRSRATPVETPADLGGRIGSGRPVVVEFFNNL